jgi:regulator of extracellular matrix RemA (YlzA/DUF370 family)
MNQMERNKNENRIVNIGFDNRVNSGRVVAIVSPNSAPIKRMLNEAKEGHLLIDATMGKPKRSVIITDSGHVVLSSISPGKLSARIEKNILE